MSRAWGLLVVAASSFLARGANADVFIVDPAGTEAFVDLQTALDTVPPGSVLLVKGVIQSGFPYVVTKSVTILDLEVETISYDTTSFTNNFVLDIQAGADDTVVVKDARIHGHISYGPSFQAIRVTSVGDLVVRDSELTGGAGSVSAFCETYDSNGDAIVIESARSVSIVDSIVQGGGPGDPLYRDNSCSSPWTARGGHGVLVEGTVDALLIEDSAVSGGTGSDQIFDCGGSGDSPFDPVGGDGGDAIHHPNGTTFLSNATLTGGTAGMGHTFTCISDLGEPGNPGADVVGTRGDLPDLLTIGDALLGRPFKLAGGGFAPNAAALLFLGTSLSAPISIRQGEWFLGAPFQFVGAPPTDAAGAFSIQTEFPNDASLVGVPFVVQATDFLLLSEPAILVPRKRAP
jgi:hypothetical protein